MEKGSIIMKKAELLKKIEQLENRIIILEAKEATRIVPYYPPFQPYWEWYKWPKDYYYGTGGTGDNIPLRGEITSGGLSATTSDGCDISSSDCTAWDPGCYWSYT